ncbi:putative Ig domain-containing protein [Subtercola endophyticus]|uniref:putative Ig domain-containing protein n=1 Tax=Subtercola endophyticus TaxID=2895559 RepID=UPI001E5E9D20|nr:putative Ig domain-containing protein [Subtercola endophyticus]UFS58960.1 putative Ig domain-containing protein [Subtercola endophyticus]
MITYKLSRSGVRRLVAATSLGVALLVPIVLAAPADAESATSSALSAPVDTLVPVISPQAMPDATVGQRYLHAVRFVGTLPVTVTLVGDLPPGLSLDSATGVIGGIPTPTTKSAYQFYIRVTNSEGYDIDVVQIGITNPSTVPVITSRAPDAGTVGKPYSYRFTASGDPAPTFAAVTTLPTGLALDPVSGTLSGIPTVCGSYTLGIDASNVVGHTGEVDYPLAIACASTPTPTPTPTETATTPPVDPLATATPTAGSSGAGSGGTAGSSHGGLASTGQPVAVAVTAGAAALLLAAIGGLLVVLRRRKRA